MTIAGSGANGAIVHYHATQKTNRALANDSLLLLDSGGQYADGTTDITRTVAIGKPSEEMKKNFTRVLKGHIAIATAVFPEGTSGSQLDALARQYLWQAGLDYDHGTGHGVGAHLSVHEGPQRIGKRGGDAALEAGMIVSNEPGYYKAGEYGIRIESLVAVKEVQTHKDGKKYFGFETITLVPIDMRLVEKSMLTAPESEWLRQYHKKVYETHVANLSAQEKQWLEAAGL
jgi:Xaa-Pro aminopeptidase